LVNGLLVSGAPADERAIAGNFRMEERLPVGVRDSYGGYFDGDPLLSLDDWRDFHRDFLMDHVNLIDDDEHPWTFRAANQENLKSQDPIGVLRVEVLDSAIGLSGTRLSAAEIEQRVRDCTPGL
jgi:hypothetical protein